MTSLQNGMTVSASYWGVQGWEVDGTAAAGYCFFVTPVSSGPTVHHVVLANDIAVGCGMAGYEAALYTSGRSSVDYIAIIGSIAYNASGGTHYCGSGISIYSPAASDSLPGTHIYVAGNFSWANVDGNPCNGSTPTDGEGIIFDSSDQYYNGGSNAYSQQAVADNNMLLANGGRGLQINNNNAGTVSSNIYFRHNTVWGNNTDLNQTGAWAGTPAEINLIDFNNTEAFQNIAVTNAIKGANGYPIYDFWATSPSTTDHVYQNVAYATSGTYSNTYEPGSFSNGPNNLFGTNPSFANATAPGAPSCGSYSSVPACMATVIANFTPTNAAAMGYGYQIPSTTQVYDPLFPQWLCNVNLPSGLVTMGCLAASSLPASPTITGVKIQ
jgi:hypothetical protein